MKDHATMKRRASDLRRSQTPAERVLWSHLRMRNVCGVRFLRQRIIGRFIVDFYAPSIRLAIELDGGQHYEPGGIRYDSRRTGWLQAQEITVLRYTNLDVAGRLNDVLCDIERVVASLKQHPPGAARRPPFLRKGVKDIAGVAGFFFPLRPEGGNRSLVWAAFLPPSPVKGD